MTHGAVASELASPELTRAVLTDYRTAPVRPQVKAMLAFLEKLTVAPQQVTAEDVRAVLESGVSARAFARATYLCTMLNVMNRLSETIGFDIPSEESLAQRAKISVDRLRKEGRVE